MPVTIRILSGARRGDEIQLDACEFRVGDSPQCAVHFDPRADPSARGRIAQIRLKDDGWYVRAEGAGPLALNRSLIFGETHLRSGDVLRMSPSGPDLSFGITARAPLRTTAAASAQTDEPWKRVRKGPRLDIAASDEGGAPGMTTPVESNVFSPDSVSRQRRRALWVAASVAAVVLFALVGWMAGSNRQGKAPGARVQQPVQENPRCSDLSLPTALTPNRAEAVPLAITPVAQDEPRLTSGGVGPLSLPDVDCESVEEILRESVLLIFVGVDDGKKSHAWPFATCSAIGESTLLTSAREILQLAAWRRQGHRMWVSRSVDGPRFAIKDFRVHHEFAALAGTPADWMYANLGLLVTEEKLPRPVRMASQKELQELEEGLPVACFGFSHGGEKLTRFHHLQVRWYRGEVYLLSDAVQENRPPRLLELKAEFPENMYGSPVVNDRGRVVGVYGETAPAQALGVENLHYATVLDVPLLQSWLAGSEQGWVSPPLGAIRVDKTESSSP